MTLHRVSHDERNAAMPMSPAQYSEAALELLGPAGGMPAYPRDEPRAT